MRLSNQWCPQCSRSFLFLIIRESDLRLSHCHNWPICMRGSPDPFPSMLSDPILVFTSRWYQHWGDGQGTLFSKCVRLFRNEIGVTSNNSKSTYRVWKASLHHNYQSSFSFCLFLIYILWILVRCKCLIVKFSFYKGTPYQTKQTQRDSC